LQVPLVDRYSTRMSKIVLIADDHPLFREALASIVSMAIPNSEIHEAIDYSETREALASQDYNLVFVDLNMPDSNGLSDLALLKKMYPQIPMIVVSAHEEVEIIRTCINHNASGYIIKSSDPEDIQNAILDILDGKTYIPNSIEMVDTRTREQDSVTDRLNLLTPSQLKVFIEMGKGKLNKQIAYDLNITEATVKAHITIVFKKLSINNRTQAVLLAQQHQAKPAPIDRSVG